MFILSSLLLSCGCHSASRQPPDLARDQPERVPSNEVGLTAALVQQNTQAPALLLTLRNLGTRKLIIQTGYGHNPLALFAFSFEMTDHRWLSVRCNGCAPDSLFGQLDPEEVELTPSQSRQFSLSLSALTAEDPHSGSRIDMQTLHGSLLVELHVPTPPNSAKPWPGYVSTSLPLP